MKCPNCGSDSSGLFCGECGAPLKGAKCKACNAPLIPGAAFCTKCGAPARERQGAGSGVASKLPWIVAGGALVVLIIVLMWSTIRGSKSGSVDDGRVPISQFEGSMGNESADGAVPGEGPLTGTPREQADRLFNRIMTEKENGDTAKAKFFLPMGLQAYQAAGDLDADGLYHYSLLQTLNGDYKAARETAERVLSSQPNHLLALSAAGGAAMAAEDRTAARKYYERFLTAYATESKKTLQEYQDHARMLPELKAEAEKAAR